MRTLHGMLITLVVVGAAGRDACCQADEKRTLKHGKHERTYILHVPKDLPKDKPVPLVIWFHGGTEAKEYPTQSGKFGEFADRDGFIFVMPHAVGGHWNDGRETDFESFKEKVDDAGFVAAMIAEIEKRPGALPACSQSHVGVCHCLLVGSRRGSFRLSSGSADKQAVRPDVTRDPPALAARACHEPTANSCMR